MRKHAQLDHQRRKQTSYLRQFLRTNKAKSGTSLFRFIASFAIKIIPRATVASSILFLLQCLYVVIRTPRLPPPPLSGLSFPRDGIIVKNEESFDSDQRVETGGITSTSTDRQTENRNEFRLVLIGDSPVEGIGNNHHSSALCGQTAKAFAKVVCPQKMGNDLKQNRYGFDCVRYWSFGQSGLDARGIEEKMVPLLYSTTDIIMQDINDSGEDTKGSNQDPIIHAIVLLCGVNNVLSPHCTPSSFAAEVQSLLASIRDYPGLEQTPIIILGLPDFAKLPFLPSWPLGWWLGMRGRKMEASLEKVVENLQLKEITDSDKAEVVIVQIPEVQDVIGSRGYYLHYSSIINDASSHGRHKFTTRFWHPLLKHLDGRIINPSMIASLEINDFLASDGFHPGKYGTTYIGSLIADAYSKLKIIS